MGIKDYPKDLRPSNHRLDSIDQSNGMKIGIDIAIWLHKTIGSVGDARLFHHAPSVPITTVKDRILALDICLEKFGVIPIYVFDEPLSCSSVSFLHSLHPTFVPFHPLPYLSPLLAPPLPTPLRPPAWPPPALLR